MKKLLLFISLCIVLSSCSKGNDSTPMVAQKFSISVSASDGGTVNTSGGEYNENASVSINATPQKGYEFSGWTGTTQTGSSIIIKVTSNQTLTANFIKSKYSLTINTVGSGTVAQKVVNSGRGTTDYESGVTIELTATPQTDFLFYNWQYIANNLGENSPTNPFQVLMDESKTVTATFEEKLPLVNPDGSGKNNTVGKWKIRKENPGSKRFSSARAVDCNVNEIIFRSNSSFTVFTETSTITGQFTIESDSSMSLNQGGVNIGRLTNLILSDNYISFTIELTDVCNEELKADKDPTYDEATDPITNTTTASQTTETSTPTTDLTADCSVQGSITTDNKNQTIDAGASITDIIWEYTTDCASDAITASSDNLLDGLSIEVTEDRIVVAGTPTGDTAGTYNFSVQLNVATSTTIINAVITVVDNTTAGSTSSTENTSPPSNTSSSTANVSTDCSVNGSITSNNENQTIDAGASITDITWEYTTDCASDAITASSISLLDGLFIDVRSDMIMVSGTPTNDTPGTYNFSVQLNVGPSTTIINAVITVVDNTTSGSTTSTTGTSSTTNNSASTGVSYSIDVSATTSADYILSGTDRTGSVSGNDPNLTLSVGDTISFVVNASGHPFYLKTVSGIGTGDTINGVENNGAESGTVVWSPGQSGTYYYQCSLHGGMMGMITVN